MARCQTLCLNLINVFTRTLDSVFIKGSNMKKKKKKLKKSEIVLFTVGFILIGFPTLFMFAQCTESIFPTIDKSIEGTLEEKQMQNRESKSGTHFVLIFNIKTNNERDMTFIVNKKIYESYEVNEYLYITYSETRITKSKKVIEINKK